MDFIAFVKNVEILRARSHNSDLVKITNNKGGRLWHKKVFIVKNVTAQ